MKKHHLTLIKPWEMSGKGQKRGMVCRKTNKLIIKIIFIGSLNFNHPMLSELEDLS
jgi:hypothetical protein